MTVHQSRRVVLALMTLLVTSITIGAPIPLAASPLHPPIANHVARPDAQFHGTHRAIAPRSPAAQFGDHGDDPFASLHFE
jgi:hypothetical protein